MLMIADDRDDFRKCCLRTSNIVSVKEKNDRILGEIEYLSCPVVPKESFQEPKSMVPEYWNRLASTYLPPMDFDKKGIRSTVPAGTTLRYAAHRPRPKERSPLTGLSFPFSNTDDQSAGVGRAKVERERGAKIFLLGTPWA